MSDEGLDTVGYWSEVKLRVLRDYVTTYARILDAQTHLRGFGYIDGFAGAGTHIAARSDDEIEGSAVIAMGADPRFSHCHFIDLDGQRAERLRRLSAGRPDVTVHHGDCNQVLLDDVFPRYRYEHYRRAFCLLDPYQLNPDWRVVCAAAETGAIEILLNFMIIDANRNVLWSVPDKAPAAQVQRMTRFWGDESWREAAYKVEPGLFGDIAEKLPNEAVVSAYCKRLREVAGFKFVPEPLPMRNGKGAVLYYLCFAGPNKTGSKIISSIFDKYRKRGIQRGD